MDNITKDDLGEWRQLAVTKAWFDSIETKIKTLNEDLGTGSTFDPDNAEGTGLKTAYVLGSLAGLRDALEMDID